jgi:hypothetical protein
MNMQFNKLHICVISEVNISTSEVRGIWSEEEIEYFQEQGLKYDKLSEVKGFWSVGTSSIYREKVRKVLSADKWSEGNLKRGEDQLSEVKGRELR